MGKEFWTLVVDAVVVLTLHFATKYLAPGFVADIDVVLLVLQPLVLLLIAKWTAERIRQFVVGLYAKLEDECECGCED